MYSDTEQNIILIPRRFIHFCCFKFIVHWLPVCMCICFTLTPSTLIEIDKHYSINRAFGVYGERNTGLVRATRKGTTEFDRVSGSRGKQHTYTDIFEQIVRAPIALISKTQSYCECERSNGNNHCLFLKHQRWIHKAEIAQTLLIEFWEIMKMIMLPENLKFSIENANCSMLLYLWRLCHFIGSVSKEPQSLDKKFRKFLKFIWIDKGCESFNLWKSRTVCKESIERKAATTVLDTWNR